MASALFPTTCSLSHDYSIMNLDDNSFELRESDGFIQIQNGIISVYSIPVTVSYFGGAWKCVREEKKLIQSIENSVGIFPHAIYEGCDAGPLGENMIVKLNDKYLLISSGCDMNHAIEQFSTDEPITHALYVVCSGGDPGSMFALSENYIYSFNCAYPGLFKIKRNSLMEQDISTNSSAEIIDIYLMLVSGTTRGFGYDNRDIPDKWFEYPFQKIPLTLTKYN
tara:strand:+ start:779 stop:1447 length:669 start_codon:yes stop_codon:yes gene_type:complete